MDEQGRLRLDIALILDEFSDAHDEGILALNAGDVCGARRAALKQRALMERIMELVLTAETQNRPRNDEACDEVERHRLRLESAELQRRREQCRQMGGHAWVRAADKIEGKKYCALCLLIEGEPEC